MNGTKQTAEAGGVAAAGDSPSVLVLPLAGLIALSLCTYTESDHVTVCSREQRSWR